MILRYINEIHIWSLNLVMLLIIFSAIGYILNERTDKYILTKRLQRYVMYLIFIALISDIIKIYYNPFWISFPTMNYKILSLVTTIIVSQRYLKILDIKQNYRSVLIIFLFLISYSLMIFIDSKSHV